MSDPTESDLRDLLTSRLAARLRLDPAELDRGERFSRYGLDSAGATALIAELSAVLGRDLSPTLIWAYPSVDELAGHLAGGGAGAGSGEVVPAASPAPQSPLQPPAAEPIAIVGVACRFPGAPDWR
ncbi:MAG TPA: phosphopantetheine-binding protein, partial [Thermoanaerobaculia bacterium]|nr:phosphopantetheine-binding protein [Thermoanaerobaculia bacterium]